MTELTQSRLKELLHYNPYTGIFNWIKRKGNVAGYSDKGYIRIRVQDKLYAAHRLAWLYTHKTFPTNEIDHINRIKDDNRLINLREATRLQNNTNVGARANNTSGMKGVCLHKPSGKWVAGISIKGKSKHLGYFTTKQEAHAAYCKAADEHHKEFANYG